jgi:hypothetical protein
MTHARAVWDRAPAELEVLPRDLRSLVAHSTVEC